MSLLPHSSLRGFDRCIDNQVAAPVFIFTIWIPYKRFGVDGQVIANRQIFVHFLMLTLSPSLSLSYLHIELIQFNFEAAVPHIWADVLLDRSGTWIFLIHHLSRLPPWRGVCRQPRVFWTCLDPEQKRADRSDKVATNSETKYRETLGQDVRLKAIKVHIQIYTVYN